MTVERRTIRPTGEMTIVIDHVEDGPTAPHRVDEAVAEAAVIASSLADRLVAQKPHAVARALEAEAIGARSNQKKEEQ